MDQGHDPLVVTLVMQLMTSWEYFKYLPTLLVLEYIFHIFIICQSLIQLLFITYNLCNFYVHNIYNILTLFYKLIIRQILKENYIDLFTNIDMIHIFNKSFIQGLLQSPCPECVCPQAI